MKTILLLILLLNYETKLLLKQDDIIKVPSYLQSKILSGKLIQHVSEKLYAKKNQANLQTKDFAALNYAHVVIYFEKYPSPSELAELDKLNIKYYLSSWTPPLDNHPLGFILAQVPIENFIPALKLDFIKKIGTSEEESTPNNNEADKKIKADLVWAQGFTGTGVKVAILDSGLDTDPPNSDLPASIQKRDYSNFPTSIDSNVENTVTGHGTHVTGSVLGRGILSSANTGNGSGSYKGSAPDADLIFLKIGSDATSTATFDAQIAAMHAAVDTFSADLLSMSYGGWDAFHDGSSVVDQTVDWVYSQGKPFFISAGNEGSSARHFSGNVAAGDSTDFIQVDVTSAGFNNTALFFNLVWSDGINRNDLSLQYFNSAHIQLASTNDTTHESSRGTESVYSNYNFYVPFGSGTYFLKVVNPSASSQDFHIFEDWNNGRVKFHSPDSLYTVGSPSIADHAFSIGAFITRTSWTASNGSGPWAFTSSETLNNIATFSSRGPRIDGLIKPSVTSPGSAIISIRDRDVYTATNSSWVDNDGTTGSGDANYFVLQGTSMACPIAAGAGALLLSKYPLITPQQVYDAITINAIADSLTGAVPNNTWGYGKLDISNAIADANLPVELSSFTGSIIYDKVTLSWMTVSEVNNFGFDIERSLSTTPSPGKGASGQWQKIGFISGQGNSNTQHSYQFVDNNSVSQNKLYYRLKQVDMDGKFKYSNVVELSALPDKFTLDQNYPNPFNPNTIIKYALAFDSRVKISVFNILGEKLTDAVDQVQSAGYQQIMFNGYSLSSGVYFYVLEASPVNDKMTFRSVKKMIIIK